MKQLTPKYLFIFLAASILFQNCHKDTTLCHGQTNYYNLSTTDKSKITYTGSDTLFYKSRTNESAMCIGQGKKQYFQTTLVPNYTNNVCEPPSTDNYEAYKYPFLSNNPSLSIEIDLYKGNLEGETIHIIYNNNIEFILFTDQIDLRQASNYLDSIQVNNLWYKNISVANQYNNPKAAKLFYNREFGVLKIQNSDSTEIWELINRK